MSKPDYPTEELPNWREVPSPGRWRVNWGTGQVVSWYYDEKTRDATYAHLFECPSATYLEIDDERFDLEDEAGNAAILKATVARLLRENTPTNA